MRTIIFVLTVGLAAIAASPTSNRIVGGTIAGNGAWPMAAAMLRSPTGVGVFRQACGGTIINNRSLVSAAHCPERDAANRWRIRVGSNNANSGGVVHNVQMIINHPSYNPRTLDSDINVFRIIGAFSFNNAVRAGGIVAQGAGIADNQAVWAIGWGLTAYRGSPSEQLRQVQIWIINQNVCRQRYATIGRAITDNMLCSGWLDVGGRDQCTGDSGGPLFHNNAVAGVCSWGHECARPFFPGVNVRVSRFTNWIRNNA